MHKNRTEIQFLESLDQINWKINVIELSVHHQELLILFIVICIVRNCM